MIRSLRSRYDRFSENTGARKLHCLRRNSLPFSRFEKYRDISVSWRGSLASREIPKNWSSLINRVMLPISYTAPSRANVRRPPSRTLSTVSLIRWKWRLYCRRSSYTLSRVNKSFSLLKGMNDLCSKFSTLRAPRRTAISAIATLSIGRKGARLTTIRECETLPLLMVISWAIMFHMHAV